MTEIQTRYKNERGKFMHHNHVAVGVPFHKNLLEEKVSKRKFYYQVSDPKTTGFLSWGPLLYGPIKQGQEDVFDEEAETEVHTDFVQAGKTKFYSFDASDSIYSNYDLYTRYLRIYEKVEKIAEKEIDFEGYPLDEMAKNDLLKLMKNRGLKFLPGSKPTKKEIIALIEDDYEKRKDVEHPSWKLDRVFQYKEEMAADTNYCVPMAIAILTGKPIQEINNAMLEIGIRAQGSGVSVKDSHRFIRYMGYKLADRTNDFFKAMGKSNISVYDLFSPVPFFKSNRKYIISSYSEKEDQGHASAVIKSELFELPNPRLQTHSVISVYEIVLNN